jgi:hypothetical protein
MQMVGYMLGLQLFYCFLKSLLKETTVASTNADSWKRNTANQLLELPQSVLLPPLHIKLGSIKISVKCVGRNDSGFLSLKQKYPRSATEKIEHRAPMGPKLVAVTLTSDAPEAIHQMLHFW